MVAAFFWGHSVHQRHIKHLTFSQFEQAVRHDRVNSVTVRGLDISGRLKAQKQSSGSGAGTTKQNKASKPEQQNPRGKKQGQKFTTTRPPFGGEKLLNLLQQHNVQISAETAQHPWWERLLISLLPWVLILGVVFYFSYRMQRRMGGSQGMFGMGRSKARRFRERSTGVKMEDVAGADNAKRDLGEVIDYLKEPQRYRKLGASIPRGVLMMGPPGTGKTLLAKAIAGEADVPFYSISGSEFIEMFVGVGAARVRDMFKNAKAEAPSLIFIDELDSIGRSRGSGMGGGNDEREQTLNQILSEMGGFNDNDAVVVLAATNRPDVLDPALMRPGRFDRKVTMEKPSRKARESILRVHAQDKPLADDVDLAVMADRTAGFSGADIENLLNEAALLAGRERREEIDMAMLNSARDRLIFGAESDVGLSDEEKRVVAYHESGHALMAYLLPRADPLDKVTIIPRGRALGATEQTPGEDRYNMSEHDLCDRIGVMLGGHMTERLVFGEVTTGAEQDLAQVSQVARRMVANWGMNESIGPVSHRQREPHPFLGHDMPGPRDFSEYTAHQIDVEMRKLIVSISGQVYNLLQNNRDKLDSLAEELLAQETLEIDAIRRLLESEPAESAET
ncbi:Cell division protein FtsH [Salinisphaera sp. LB1]|nr:Cell division protein FtsH [Salinisphaera sp. LB1]